MPKYCAKIIVRLKDVVKDTQGHTLDKVLSRLNIENDAGFRCGKFFSFNLNGTDINTAKKKLEFICNEVISNRVVETYDILSFEEIK